MANQGEKSANEGDILKHRLICDVLQKCIDAGWEKITYAETHAGAGVYSSRVQPVYSNPSNPKAFIKNLYKKFNLAASKDEKPNDPYFKALESYWGVGNLDYSDKSVEIKYTGSAYLAASILKKHYGNNFDIRLTEYKHDICEALKSSLCDLLPTEFVDNHILQDGFQNQITWLTEKDDLVLIIDPFNLSLNFKGINKGDIDLYHLLKLTESVKDKTKAVVGFWYPTNQNSNQLGLSKFFDQTITKNYGELNCRKYFRGIYNFILIGFGEGQNIVNALPLQSELHPRWFDLEITERLFHERRNKSLLDIKNLMHLEEIYKTTIQQIIEHKTIKGLLRSIKKSRHLNDIHKATLEQIIKQIDNSEPEVANEG